MNRRYVAAAVIRRPLDTFGAALAVGLTVAFLASLGSFVAQTGSQLTARAAARVPVDWQVQVGVGGTPAAVLQALRSVPGVTATREVDFAKVAGFTATTSAGTRTAGAGYVVGLPPDYAVFAPSELRPLVGSARGVLLQQQTAANLGATPGAVVRVQGSPDNVRVSGVVDLPNADSFFQDVGAAPGSTSAPAPDNVLIVPYDIFARLVPASTVVHQVHVRFDHTSLPADPAKAADEMRARANHFVTAVSGAALVGNNLQATLSSAREDAIFAQLLVLLLGAPGLVLSAVVTALVISLRNDRQHRDLGLLRLRGVTPRHAAGLLAGTAAVDGLVGVALGLVGAAAATRAALGPGRAPTLGWLVGAAVVGLLLAVSVELFPVLRLLGGHAGSVRSQSEAPRAVVTPLPLRLWLDVILLAAAGIAFWLTSRSGYQVVVVPEGVPVASVNYAALVAPALAWPGLALLVWRLTQLALRWRRRQPVADPRGRMPDLRAEVARRRRHVIARGATRLAVAIAVTTSTAVFTTTYDQQARLDVALTVGSDVAVTTAADSPTGLDPAIAKVRGAQDVELVSHRLAYVGPDLQDLYGIDARTVGRAAPLQDAFTPGSSVQALMSALARIPDGVLLSQETLHDYQLRRGDTVRLRLRNATGAYIPVRFQVVGVVTEFATAPRDSFVIANRSYVASATGINAVQTLLVRTTTPRQVAAAIQAPPQALVNDVSAPKVAVPSASGLAAGSLAGLSKIVLAFGVLLALASASLVLVVGAAQRRRSVAALAVLGASVRQRAAFLWTEARWIVTAGVIGGTTTGLAVAYLLVKVLNGIFDPPPQQPAVPLLVVAGSLAAVVASAAAAAGLSARWSSRVTATQLRDL